MYGDLTASARHHNTSRLQATQTPVVFHKHLPESSDGHVGDVSGQLLRKVQHLGDGSPEKGGKTHGHHPPKPVYASGR